MNSLRTIEKRIPAPSIQDVYVGDVSLAVGNERRFMR